MTETVDEGPTHCGQGPAEAQFSDEERRVLDDVNGRVAAAESLSAILEFLLERTADLCPADRLSVAFLEPGERLVSHTTRASYSALRLAPGYSEGIAGSSLEAVLREGRPRVIADLEQYGRDHPESHSTRLILEEGIRSSMTCPLTVDGRRVGVFWRSSRRKAAYGDRQIRMHMAVAVRLAQSVEKAYRIAELQAATQAYAEMLAFVSHELKSPVASIMTDVRLITDGYLGDVGADIRRKLEGVLRKGGYLLNLVREYLDLARVEAGSVGGDFTVVGDWKGKVLAPAMELVTPRFEEKGQKLEEHLAADLPAVECDPDLLRIVAVNFLDNASKYGREGGLVRVTAEIRSECLRFSVWNEGPGFSPAGRARLFRRFSRLEDPELRRRRGTGVGLYTAARIIEVHAGRVGADSSPGEWAEFWFEIPLRRSWARGEAT